jgi:hypothetical protein
VGGAWRKAFLVRPGARDAAIQLSKDSTITRDAVVVWFTPGPSDDYLVIWWDGGRYHMQHGFDVIREEIRKELGH